MVNMSYCRFKNTYQDLLDCYDNINSDCSEFEKEYRKQLVKLCQAIINEYDPYIDEETDEEIN